MSELQLSPTLKRILLEALIIVTLSGTIGLSVNYSMVMNAFTGKAVQGKPPANKQVAKQESSVAEQLFPNPIELDEIDEMLADGALLVDARNNEDYKAGHLAEAISLPLGQVNSMLDSFRQQVAEDQPLILYCNGFGCPDSFDLGVLLLKAGYQQVWVYEGGFPEWRDAGRPVEEGL